MLCNQMQMHLVWKDGMDKESYKGARTQHEYNATACDHTRKQRKSFVLRFFLLSNVLRSTGPSNLPDMRPQAWSDNVRYRWKNVCAAGKDLAGGAEGAISDPCIQINAHVRASTVQAEEPPVHLGRDEQGRVRHNLLVHDAAGGIGQMSPGGEQSYVSKDPIDKGYSDMKSWAWLDFYKNNI